MERTNQARISQPANDLMYTNKKSEQYVRIFLWYLQEEITLFHLISKTPKSLKINDITSFLL